MLFPNNWFAEVTKHFNDHSFTILGSISQMSRLTSTRNLIVYNWDMYSWQDYSSGAWKEFGYLCREAVDIWYPSQCTKEMTKKIYGVDKGVVIKMFVPTDWVKCGWRGDYVLLPMRHYTKDPCFDWARRACEEMNIPFFHPNHDLPHEEYRNLLANCNMVVSPYAEASTGGMGMLEAAKCGKPVLANSSPLNGARDYMGDYATYFDGYEDFCDRLWQIYSTPGLKKPIARTVEDMGWDIMKRICTLPLPVR